MAAIYFDMDGTIADFYGVDGWLNYVQNEDVTPYEVAKPLCKEMTFLKSALARLKSAGYTIGVISWTAMNGSKEYNKAVRRTKLAWLKKYFGDLFTEIHVVKYGTNKYSVAKEKNGILFDDDETVRAKWRGTAYDAKDIITEINNLINIFNSNAEDLIKQALQDKIMAYCYTATDYDGSTFVKVGMTIRGEQRIKEYKYKLWRGGPEYRPTNKEYIVFFPCKTEYDAHAMECSLHHYFFFYDCDNQNVYIKNDRFKNVPALREEMLREDGELMRDYHKLGY